MEFFGVDLKTWKGKLTLVIVGMVIGIVLGVLLKLPLILKVLV